MTDYRMPPHLFACAVDGKHVFLDLERDRYFRLPHAEAAVFAALLQGDASGAPSDLQALVKLGVLATTAGGKAIALTRHPLPERSLVESLDAGTWRSARLRDLIEVTALVRSARRTVARRQLPRAFASLSAARGSGSSQQKTDLRDRLIERFLAVRSLVPQPAKCLHDTLAISRFLARRGVYPHIVLGVKLHPFGAHCWLQDRGIVLNDALSSARAYQPVLVA